MALEDIRRERLSALARLRERGIDPFPSHSTRTHTASQFLENHASLQQSHEPVVLAGRVMSIREHGGSVFVDIFDGTARTQMYIKQDEIGDDAFGFFSDIVDVSDTVEFSGTAFITKRGMPSLSVTAWRMLAKSLRPVPSEWFGIKDEEERYRKRYLDLLLSKDLSDRFRRRSLFWNAFRRFLLDHDYIEVETPVLETTTGGADARPFITHHNALDIDVFLRISAGELWQKRLMVAGFHKVFEIGRIFRNEGMSSEHLQDYTQIEFYESFKDYEEGMDMVTELYQTVAKEVYNTQQFTTRGHEFDLSGVWKQYNFCTLMKERYSIDPLSTTVEDLRDVLSTQNIQFDARSLNVERGVDLLWKKIRKTLSGPGFLIGVPTYLEPLAKRSAKDPRIVERFQIIIAGSEIGKGFSELNDPIDQAERFAHQQEMRNSGDDEAQMYDASYVEALEYGMPPAFGFGVSERLFSFLEDIPVREGQLFPILKPKE